MSRFKKAEKAFTCLLVVLLISSLSHADYISGVTASSNDAGMAGYGAQLMVDGTGWIDNDPADDVHVADNNAYGMYVSESYTVLEGSVFGWVAGPYYLLADGVTWDPWELYLEYDLGGSYDLDAMHIWNGAQTHFATLGRGLGKVDIAYSNDGGATYTNAYTGLSLQDARALYSPLAHGDYFAASDILSMTGITADHVRIIAYPDYDGGTFNGDTTPGDPWDHEGYSYQMSEVKFAGTVAVYHPDYISGVTASASDGGTPGFGAELMTDGTGFIPDDHVADDSAYGMYVSDAYTVHDAGAGPVMYDGAAWIPFELYLEFDLGGIYYLEDIYIWNGAQTVALDRGFGTVDIAVSNDGGATYSNAYTGLSLQDARTLYSPLAHGDYFAASNILSMTGITADHVRIIAYPDYDGGTFNGDTTSGDAWDHAGYSYQMSEVRFAGTAVITTFSPVDGAVVSSDTMLTWEDVGADAYDVYLDVDRQAVLEATDPDVYPGRGRHYAGKCNPLFLEEGQTYYWRVDPVYSGIPITGSIQEFKTGGYIDSSHITATASSTYTGHPPEFTIDDSGMQGGLHENSTWADKMWLSNGGSGEEWIQYEFDQVYYFNDLTIWNFSQFPCCPGRSIKNVTIEIYNGTWTTIGDFTLTQPPGTDLYEATDIIDMQGQPGNKIRIKSWTVAAGGSYGDSYRGLAEVRFTTAILKASHPTIVDDPQSTLHWVAGDSAISHQVYLGTDATAVVTAGAGSPEHLGSSADAEFGLPALDPAITYYCRVDEVGASATTTGDIWQLDTDYKAVYYVATDGSDTNDGSCATPFATIEKARDAVKDLMAARVLPQSEIVVYLRGGKHLRTTSVEFTQDHSGTYLTPIVYRAFPGEEPRIIGGEVLDPAWFSAVTSFSPVWSRLDASAQGNLMQVDLAAHGITDYGSFRDGQGYGRGLVSHMELFFNQQRMELGRWPNAASSGSDDFNNGNDFATVAGENSDTSFYYSGTRPERWTDAPDMLVTGYWLWGWADFYYDVFSINTTSKIINLTTSSIITMRPTLDHPWYALNLLEEIDIAGEWYMDRDSGILYFWPPESLPGNEIIVSMLGEEGAGTDNLGKAVVKMEDTSYLSLDGLVVEMCRYDGVAIDGGHHNAVTNCTIRNTGSMGVYIVGGYHNGVSNSHLHDLNAHGITLNGGDRYNLSHCYNYARNNHIHDFSVWCRAYSPGVQVEGDGCIVSHNVIHSAPHSAIIAGEWYRQWKPSTGPTNCILEYNEIYDMCRDGEDAGAVYLSFGWEKRGQIFRYNFVHDIFSRWYNWTVRDNGAHGLYQDLGNSGLFCFGNIFYNIDSRGVFIASGRDNTIDNNIFSKVVSGAVACFDHGDWINEITGHSLNFLERLLPYNHLMPPWSKAFPAITTIPDSYTDPDYEGVKKPEGNKLYRSIGYDNGQFTQQSPWGGNEFVLFWDIQDNIEDQDPKFVDEANLNMNLQPSSPVYSIPGWQDIPFDDIGIIPAQPSVQVKWSTAGVEVRGSCEPFCSINSATIVETGQDVSGYLQVLSNGSITGTIPSGVVTSTTTVTVRIITEDPQRPSLRDLSLAEDSNTVGFCLGDIVADGRVDLVDFAEISNGWLNPEVDCTNPDNKDLSGDCMVNLEDILIFATYWLLD